MPSRIDLANAIRALSMDAVQQANSGHPGAPMGMADIAQVLWADHLKHNPTDPNWMNRDRFVLSNGHGSMLIYALLHLTGYDLSIEDLKQFRQLHSKTPGHPEFSDTPGVETTTGPLGQGISNAVGFALAEKMLAARFNQTDATVIDHHTYVFAGDGCLMEGVSHESCSLAGTWGLGKLIVFWDNNGISIDGEVAGWFNEDVAARYRAYGWQVIAGVDGHNPEAISEAIKAAKSDLNRPTLIDCRTTIGFGAPTVGGTEKCHGAPLGPDEIARTRKALGWSHPPFEIPKAIYDGWDARQAGHALQTEWTEQYKVYEQRHPVLAAELKDRLNGYLPEDFGTYCDDLLAQIVEQGPSIATRKASYEIINAFSEKLPALLGGSADLTGSNLTAPSNAVSVVEDFAKGNYIHYGVREFGMMAIMNGLALHGGFIPFGGTFLTFLDYAKNATRMAAIMKQRCIYVFTHDSIGLGEDGPTHQPVEQLAVLRATPNIETWRPCDKVETFVAWRSAIERTDGPTALALSRQTLPHQQRTMGVEAIAQGAYVLYQTEQRAPDLMLIATGSEVSLAVDAAKELAALCCVRVVSMPSMDRFAQQSQKVQEEVLPKSCLKRIAIEAASSQPWYQYVGLQGKVCGLDGYGASAPANELYEAFGFTVKNVVQLAKELLGTE